MLQQHGSFGVGKDNTYLPTPVKLSQGVGHMAACLDKVIDTWLIVYKKYWRQQLLA